MKTKLMVLLAAVGLWAQDIDPEAVVAETAVSVTQIEPPTLTVTVVLSPVVKINGTNTANIVSVMATKQRLVRKLINGVQVGEVEVRQVEPSRDILPNLLTRTNGLGVLGGLNLAPGKSTMLWSAYNVSTNSVAP